MRSVLRVVVFCLMLAVRRSLALSFVVRCFLRVVSCVLFVASGVLMSFVVCCLLFECVDRCCLSFVVRCLVSVVCCVLSIGCSLSCVDCCWLSIVVC